jgi:hypothetical protein
MRSPEGRVASRSFSTLALVVIAAACGSSAKTSAPAATTPTTHADTGSGPLVGLFKIVATKCAEGAAPTGSYLQMVQSGGTPASGPFVSNADSICTNKAYTALVPGTDGGLTTGAYQPQPNPPFDAAHNGVANKILQPAKFFGTGFAISTNAKDAESGKATPAPSVTSDASGKLTGNASAFSVAWNGQQFNQGAPKPDGSSPGSTKALHGTYDKTTGAFVLDWSSQIVGGPFNGFTGVWHLVGTFTKS